MSDRVATEIRTLIRQNHELETRLRELQVAIAGIRADFEAVMFARMRELDAAGTREAPPQQTDDRATAQAAQSMVVA